MTSTRKVEANRRNAARSTGPRTARGKVVSTLNALRHGPLTRAVLIGQEREAELVAFARGLRAQLLPVGELELLLVDRLITSAWRLRRLLGVETALLNGELQTESAFTCGREAMICLSRYEMSVERSFYRALHELQRLQATRRGDAVPPPQAVDATIDVAGLEES